MISIGREIQAFRIDEAFKEILKGGLIDITQEVPGLYHQAMPEIDAIMDIVYYLYSTKADGASPGMKLFGIEHSSRGKKTVLLSCVIIKWIFKRLERFAMLKNWRQLPSTSLRHKLWKLFTLTGILAKMLALMNFLLFISRRSSEGMSAASPYLEGTLSRHTWQSAARTEFSDLPVASASPSQVHLLSRKEQWAALQAFLHSLFLLCDWDRLGTTAGTVVRAALRRLPIVIPLASRLVTSSDGESRALNEMPMVCVACDALNAECCSVGECGHVHCYYCLKKHLLIASATKSVHSCQRCGQELTYCRRIVDPAVVNNTR